MATTIHDVARVAGVGIGTVSRVINKNPGVKPATREKVLMAIAQLHFKPHPIARSMISRRTGSIGVIVPFFTRPFFIEILQGIQKAISRLEVEMVLYSVETDGQRENYFSNLPMHRKVDGLLIISLPLEDMFAIGFKEIGIATVLIDTYSPLFTSLVVDNIEGAYQAVKSLIQKGHRRIGFIKGIQEGNFKFNQPDDRLIGMHRALGEAGFLFEPELILTTGWDRSNGKEAALQILSQEKRPTAIFAASDMLAVGVLEAARDLNIEVPADLSVIGFDGIELSELLGLTTMQQPMRQMGELGVSKLLEQIENPLQIPELIRLSTTLVERRSTASLNVTFENAKGKME